MNCEQALVFLSAALDGELTEFERQELERHMSGCPECRAISEDFGVVSVALSAMSEAPPADLIGRINEVLDGEQPSAAPVFKAGHRQKWGSMVAGLAVVLCLGGIYAFTVLGGGTTAKDAAAAPQASAYMEKSEAIYDGSGYAPAQEGETGGVRTEDTADGACEAAETAPSEAPQATFDLMESVNGAALYTLTAEEAAERILAYLGGAERYPAAAKQAEDLYLLEREEDGAKACETVLRYLGLSPNGRYHTFQTYRQTTDDHVATFSEVNHYAVKLDGSELLLERDETGSDNAEAFRAALENGQ